MTIGLKMIIRMLRRGKLERVGYIRYDGHEVILEAGAEQDLFASVMGRTPQDGIDYLKAVLSYFARSSGIVLVKESVDKEWMDSLVR